ncbi:ankyrin repeat domain-containing protein [Hymenobacter sp. DH14]|uniref:Ankyrin repeat domain-containing protein n=1 Tax=Hymenobacter cyanobacteriorum TaxID=2926463 RepID=A0A9X1VCD2_9BACT|nr:ankyrin repeat domain-containing protein [Hymenobacter cyanobacteriorum]MCI1185968.1 ankyrin repeat domain-containing protein [Hymenobacter cyanobacteriorum]
MTIVSIRKAVAILSLLLTVTAVAGHGQGIDFNTGKGQDKKLYEAVSAKDTTQVQAALDKGANPNFRVKAGFFEMSLLILAVQKNDFATVKLLLDHQAEVDFRDAFNMTALMFAAHSGNKKLVSYLISKGADVKAHDGKGNSVLSAAQESKNQEVIQLIESKLKE